MTTIYIVLTSGGAIYAAYADRATADSIAASISGRVEETILL